LSGAKQASARADAPSAPVPGGRVLRLRGRGALAGAPAGAAGAARVVRRLELLDGAQGAVVGELVATSLGSGASFGAPSPAGACVELQTFRIGDDTLFGMGTEAARAGERAYAVLGGTGRFAGARGACVERSLGDEGAARGQVEFLVTLVG
jgi:hypothetical protein